MDLIENLIIKYNDVSITYYPFSIMEYKGAGVLNNRDKYDDIKKILDNNKLFRHDYFEYKQDIFRNMEMITLIKDNTVYYQIKENLDIIESEYGLISVVKTKLIDEYEFPNLTKYHKSTHHKIHSYNYTDDIIIYLLQEEDNFIVQLIIKPTNKNKKELIKNTKDVFDILLSKYKPT
jgi:hypothetical protein